MDPEALAGTAPRERIEHTATELIENHMAAKPDPTDTGFAERGAGVGISGFSSYLPAYQVSLEDWCDWRGDSWAKVGQVVGESFRMRGPDENAYTMAATAVLRLIEQHGIDAEQIGFLGLGTESSTDNSAGAVIVKGMVNQALLDSGRRAIARACEVPEFKHACLGGVYAMKAAARFLATDGRDKVAIVVCADIAEYERATSGEPTQGAGAVAMLLEPEARLATIELDRCGSASDYRGVDFRKPFLRFMQQAPTALAQPRDFPVFNGKYSTSCYVDEVLAAMRDLFRRLPDNPAAFLRDQAAIFLHRPYQRMAETGLSMSYLLALALGSPTDQAELATYARMAEVDCTALIDELTNEHAEFAAEPPMTEGHPLAGRTARAFRQTEQFAALMTGLGTAEVGRVGNLYTASLPLWLAAGLEQAATQAQPLSGRSVLTIGYGSGDAAEIIPLRLVPGWELAAQRGAIENALAAPVNLERAGYEALHEGHSTEDLAPSSTPRFVIDRIGNRDGAVNDLGVEYYRYIAAADRGIL